MTLIHNYSIKYPVELIPQSMSTNCGFACIAMVLKYKKLLDMTRFKNQAMAMELIDNCSGGDNPLCLPHGVKPPKGSDRYKGYQISPEQFDGIGSVDSNRTFSRLGFKTNTTFPATAKDLFDILVMIHGPLIFNSMMESNVIDSHFRVITGMDYYVDNEDTSTGNDSESVLYINDPYEKGMKKFTTKNKGGQYTMPFYKLFLEINDLKKNDTKLGVAPGKSIFFAYHL